jgi:hypothetical protein
MSHSFLYLAGTTENHDTWLEDSMAVMVEAVEKLESVPFATGNMNTTTNK